MRRRKKRAKAKLHCPLGTPETDHCVAFCRLHGARMTLRQMRNRKCMVKKCQHFRPRKEHTYWATVGLWQDEKGETE